MPGRPIHPTQLKAVIRLGLAAAIAMCIGCDKPKHSNAAQSQKSPQSAPASAPKRLPSYTFSVGVEAAQPEVAGFVRSFMETCLAGDYRGYRRLVSRFDAPETEGRFSAIYKAVLRATIQSIEPLPERSDGRADFLVITDIEFDPESNIAVRRKSRQVAMLVFKEEGAWRMARAPASLQPHPELAIEEDAPESAPASGPSYPWDVEP